METIVLSKVAYLSLIESLLELEENHLELLDSYFPLPTQNRKAMDSLIVTYLSRMNRLLETVTADESSTVTNFPLVTIGSAVTVKELDTQTVTEFHIILPTTTHVGARDISIFSPLGKALLLQEPNAEVEYHAPGGRFRYQILGIAIRCKIDAS